MSSRHEHGPACGHDHAWITGVDLSRAQGAGLAMRGVTIVRNGAPVVEAIEAELLPGRLTAILGPNGAGKSSLLLGILGELPLHAGTVTLAGRPIAVQRQRIAWLPQRAGIDWDFPLTVREVVEQGRVRQRGWWRGFTAEDRRAVAAAVAEMGLGELQGRGISRLSGGQQQRVLIARALATGAEVLLLDEPLAGLDPAAAEDLLHALDTAARRGRIIALVVHDLALVRAHVPQALLLNRHLIAAGPTTEVLAEANLSAAFGERALVGVLHALHAHGTP